MALKKIRNHFQNEGLSGYTMREIALLQQFKHANIVKVLNTVLIPNNINIIFEYMPYSLENYIDDCKKNQSYYSHSNVKKYLSHLLHGIDGIHSKRIMHRDLKPQNILLSPNYETLKIADFGLARKISVQPEEYTVEVCTLWYRAPEMLMTNGNYGKSADMWAVGCLFAELLSLEPLFPGDSAIDQLNKIFGRLGTPTEDEWPGINVILKGCISFPINSNPVPLEQINGINGLTQNGIDLLYKMLTINPYNRISAKDALAHPYFTE